MEIYDLVQKGLAAGETEPVTVAEAKSWGVIETSLDDAVITSLITTAREMVEAYISRDLIPKTYTLYTDEILAYGDYFTIDLCVSTNLASIASVADEFETFTSSTDYEVIGASGSKLLIKRNYGGRITVEFDSIAMQSSTHLETCKSAIKSLIEQLYDNRGNLEGDSDIMVMDRNIKAMLAPVRNTYF